MVHPVAVVTDSTASLPEELLDRVRGGGVHVEVVPLGVVLDGRTCREGVDVDVREVALALRSGRRVTTSRPTPEDLDAAYERAGAAGAEAVVSVHLAAALSGTWDSARLAAGRTALPVTVVDSGSVGMGVGFAVLAAAAAAARDEPVDAVAQAAQRTAAGTRAYFYVDTLEHLRRGGRIGAAQAYFGHALAIKPVLQLVAGEVAPLEKVRTAGRALSRLADLAATAAGGGAADLAVHHVDAPDQAARLAGMLRQRVPAAREVIVTEVGAALGAHAGPGLVSVVVARR